MPASPTFTATKILGDLKPTLDDMEMEVGPDRYLYIVSYKGDGRKIHPNLKETYTE